MHLLAAAFFNFFDKKNRRDPVQTVFKDAFVVVKITFSKKFFQEHYQNAKRFGPRSGPTLCRF